MSDRYADIYKIDAYDEYVNGAYDEDGNGADCDDCSGEMFFRNGKWVCRNCGRVMTRSEFLNHIGAEPPGSRCITNCHENYPLCKKCCKVYEIDPDDPILD